MSSTAATFAWPALIERASASYRRAGRFALHFARGKLRWDPVFRHLLSQGLIAPGARLIVVTPSHQYPLGVSMGLERRLELLDWANKNDVWVIELARNLVRRVTSHEWLIGRLRQAHPGVRLLHQAQRLDDLEQRLTLSVRRWLDSSAARLHAQAALLARFSPGTRIRELSSRRAEYQLRLRMAVQARMSTARARMDLGMRALNAVSPLATLDRGYAIVTRSADGQLLRSAEQVAAGEDIEARLSKGRVVARVKDIKE